MRQKSISSENGITYYWISKSPIPNTPCLVFSHGLCANHTMFEKQINAFKSLYTLITSDIPLHGMSRPYSNFSYHHAALELNRILEQERQTAVVLIGMSMGGYPCQVFAIQFPEKVSAFIAIDTTPFGVDYYSASDLWWLRQTGKIIRCIPDRTMRKMIANANGYTSYSQELMLNMLSTLRKHEICQQINVAYHAFCNENCNVHFTFPCLIMVGKNDHLGKVKQYCQNWAETTGYALKIIHQA